MRRSVLLVSFLMSAVASTAVGQYFRGELTTRYRSRWGTEDYEDQDLYSYLWLTFWDDEQEQELGGAVSLRWDKDLQTRANEIDDGDDDLRVYYAYIDVNKLESFDLRLGRQILDDAEGFQITGAKGVYRFPWKKARLGFFGGEPVSYYSSLSGEWAAGASWSLKPDPTSHLRGSWIHVEEELAEDDIATVSFRRASKKGWSAWGTVRTLNFDVWNELLGGRFRIAPLDLHVTATYRRQENTNDSASRYYSHFASTLGPSLPYQRMTVNLNRAFGESFSLGAGWNRRELLRDDENRANQEYTRFFFDVFLHERLLNGFEASIDFSRWYTDRDDNSSVSGSISRRIGDRLRLDLGTYYAKYEIRRYFDRPDEVPIERFDVRTYYLQGDWRVRRKYRIQVELERGTDSTSDDPYNQLELRFGLDLGFLARGFSQ